MKFVSAAHLTGGGTITGDLTISGDLTVSGTSGGYAFTEVLTGDMIIDQNANAVALTIDTEATGAYGMHFNNPAQTTNAVFAIVEATALTTGQMIRAVSSSTSTSIRNLVDISNTAAASTGTTVMKLGQNSTNYTLDLLSDYNAGATGGARMRLHSDDGTVMVSGDRLGSIEFAGAENTSAQIAIGAKIEALATETWDTSNNDADLVFYTTNADQQVVERMRIASTGSTTIKHLDGGSLVVQPSSGVTSQVAVNNSGGSEKIGMKGAQNSWSSGWVPGLVGNSSNTIIAAAGDYQLQMGVNNKKSIIIDDGTVGIKAWSYSTGTASQSGTTVTGGSTVWTAAMIGREFIYANGVSSGLITARASNTSITVTTSQTVSSQDYGIYYSGFQLTSAGKVGIGTPVVNYQSTHIKVSTSASDSILGIDNAGSGTTSITMIRSAGVHQWTHGVNTSGSYVIANQHNVNGAIKMVLDSNSRISLSNNDGNTSNTVFGKNAFTDAGTVLGDVGADWNTVIGEDAMGHTNNITDATYNVAVGYKALTEIIDGDNNVAIGANALLVADGTESNNVAIGFESMSAVDNSSSEKNIAIGRLAFTGGSGIAIGNIAIGHKALITTGATAQYGNIAIGYEALTLQDTATAVAIGDTDNPNIAIGYQAGARITSGDSNVLIGHLVHGKAAGDGRGDDNVYIGARSAYTATDADSNVAIGRDSLYSTVAGSFNIAIGHSALYTANHTSNNGTVAIGYEACKVQASTSGAQFASSTVGIGYQALTALTTGTHNTAIGYQAAMELATNSHNTVVGYQAMYRSTAAVYYNTFIGSKSGSGDWSGGAYSNTAVGANTMAGAMTATTIGNVAVGRDALAALTTGANNVAIGLGTGDAITTDSNVVAIGYGAYSSMDTADDAEGSSGHGSGNIAIGYQSMTSFSRVDAIRNTAVGFQTMSAGGDDNAQDNTALGYRALQIVTTGDANTALGSKAGKAITTGSGSTAIGHDALENNTASECVGVGKGAGQTNTSGINNTFVGTDADSSGNFNYQTALGWGATTTQNSETNIGVDNPVRQISKSVTCNLGGTTANDPAHATAIGMIPRYSVITKACALVTTLSDESNHSLKLVLSTDSSATDNTVLNNVQDLIGSTVECWSGQYTDGTNSNILVGSGAIPKVALAAQADGTDAGLSTIDTTVGSDANLYVYLAFADSSYSGDDDDPSTAAVVKVFIEYCGLD